MVKRRRGGSLVAMRNPNLVSMLQYPGYTRYGMGQGGAGFLDFVKKAFNFGKKVNDTLKNTKVISRGADVLKDILPGRAGEIATSVGNFAGAKGYGRRRRPRRGGALVRI
jgi:hypothetical protein